MNDPRPPIRRLPLAAIEHEPVSQQHLCEQLDALIATAIAARSEPGRAIIPVDSRALADAFAAFPAGARLRRRYGLDDFACALLGLLLADALDPQYGPAWAVLADDAGCRRPTLDHALTVFGCDRPTRLALLAEWAVGPLCRHDLVIPARASATAPLQLDPQVRALFLPDADVDSALAPFCRLTSSPAAEVAEIASFAVLPAALHRRLAQAPHATLRVHLHGPDGSGTGAIAASIAAAQGMHLLCADFGALAVAEPRLIARLCREAFFRGAVLQLAGLDRDAGGAPLDAAGDALRAALDDYPIHVVFVSRGPLPADWRLYGGVLRIAVAPPDAAQRARLWQAEAARVDLALSAADIDSLAQRYRLSASQVAQAADDAAMASEAPTPRAACEAAARALSGHALEQLARRVSPRAGWHDLVVPADVEAQLHEISQRVCQRALVARACGDGHRLLCERGVTALFAGPSGTGKTLAAEVIAAALGLDLFCIDLAQVVSKYIGETEKNLDRVFAAAESANAVLFFDEADALFGRRSEVKDAHDRYANLEIAYLLQKMEQFEGLAILATNLRQNLDDAFTRRLTFAVNFPFPQEIERRRLWQVHWPAQLARAAEVDLDELARGLPLAGGNIRNLVLAAAHYATAERSAVERRHVLRATRREYQKMGKTLSEADWQRLGFAPAPLAEFPA